MSNYYFTNNEKYGYVEDVEHEKDYKNIDYRDTTVPLWNTLFHNKKNNVTLEKNEQNQINSALCASIIQLGKNLDSRLIYMSKKINKLEEKINSLEKVTKYM